MTPVRLTGMVGLVLAGLLVWYCRPLFPFGVFNDDAAYWLESQCLLGQRSVADFSQPPLFLYPVGQALFLMPACWLGAGDPEVGRFWMTFVSFLTGLLSVALACRFVEERTAWLVGLLTILNFTALSHGSTLLSDVGAGFVVLAYLATPDSRPASERRWVYRGVWCGLAYFMRVTLAALAIAEIVNLISGRRWRRLFHWCAGYGATILSMTLVTSGVAQVYLKASQEDSTPILVQQWLYWSNLPSLVGQGLFGLFGAASPLGWAVLVLAAVGGFRLLRGQPQADGSKIVFFSLFFLAGHSLWPYPSARYFLPLYPLLFLLALSLPRRRSWVLGFVLLLCTVPAGIWTCGRVQEFRPLASQRNEIYRFLAERIPQREMGVATFSLRSAALSRRRCLQLLPAQSPSQLLWNEVGDGANWILFESVSLLTNFREGSPISFPPFWNLWLERNGLVEVLYQDRWATVFRLRPAAFKLLQAYPRYLRACQMSGGQPEQRQRARVLLGQALSMVGDFPEARSLLGTLLLEDGKSAEGIAMLEPLVEQYPFDFVSVLNLGLAYESVGRDPGPLLQASLEWATRLNDPAAAGRIREQLRRSH